MRNYVKFNTKLNSLIIKSNDSIEKNVLSISISKSEAISFFSIDSTISENNTKLYALYYDNVLENDSIKLLTFNSIEDAQICKNKIEKELLKKVDKTKIMKGILYVLAIVILFKFLFIPNSLIEFSGLNSNQMNTDIGAMNNNLDSINQEKIKQLIQEKAKQSNENQPKLSPDVKKSEGQKQQEDKQSADELEKLLNSSK